MGLFSPEFVTSFFGLLNSEGNAARMSTVMEVVRARLEASYGELGPHLRRDTFILDCQAQPFQNTHACLKLAAPFVTRDKFFDVSCGPIGCDWKSIHNCFCLCSGSGLTEDAMIDQILGKVTLLCPKDRSMYRVTYRAGFETDADGFPVFPAPVQDYVLGKIEEEYAKHCASSDEDCDPCRRARPYVLLEHQRNALTFRFLPTCADPITSEVLTEEQEAELLAEIEADAPADMAATDAPTDPDAPGPPPPPGPVDGNTIDPPTADAPNG